MEWLCSSSFGQIIRTVFHVIIFNMKYSYLFVGVIVLALAVFFYISSNTADAPTVTEDTDLTPEPEENVVIDYEKKPDLIIVDSIDGGEVISSPLTITGEARGYWYFEASFPIVLTNWDGLIIAEGHAQANDDWMTEDFVPFTAKVEFTSPYQASSPAFMSKGTLILKRDNPSGLPENDDALEIPVIFAPEVQP